MIVKTSRTRAGIFIASGIIIALAAVLFVSAISRADSAQPGQALFYGRSGILIAVSFALLTGLACALLVIISRTGKAADAGVFAYGKGRVQSEAVGAEAPEGATLSSASEERSPEDGVGVLSDATGKLKTSVAVIQEELGEILEDEAPVDRVQVQSIFEETDRLRKIIVSMEQLSRVQEIARLNKKDLLDIEQLLKGIIETTRQTVPNQEVAYILECETGLAMKGDPECIGTIIGNITDNAARSLNGQGSVILTANRKNETVVFTVRDTGTGIRRTHLSHIYERFFRGAGTGIGMGLAIVKELVDACGGTIEVQTEMNEGTTFTVRMSG